MLGSGGVTLAMKGRCIGLLGSCSVFKRVLEDLVLEILQLSTKLFLLNSGEGFSKMNPY